VLVEPPVAFVPPAFVEPPVAFVPPVLAEPPVDDVVPEPTNDVTLDASSDTDSEPFVAVTVPSLARLLLEDVVYFVKEEIVVPGIEIASVLAEPVLTTLTTTEVALL
jgi:hypothetical protein